MLKSEKFFGKRDKSTAEARPFDPIHQRHAGTSASSSVHSGTASLASVTTPSGGVVARVTPGVISAPALSGVFANAVSNTEIRSKLTVGPNIKLKGVEITDCDTLVVEGRVEASIDSRVIQISEKGAFVGNAEFDIAEIRGEFEGELTVRQKLVVYASGRVSGKVRYGKLVIEEGGQICGDVQITSVKNLTAVISA